MPANPTARESNSTEAEVVSELRGVLVCPSAQRDIMNRAAALIESQRATIERQAAELAAQDDALIGERWHADEAGRQRDVAKSRVTAIEAEKAEADKRVALLEGSLHLLRMAVEAGDPKRELLLRIDDDLALAQPSTQEKTDA